MKPTSGDKMVELVTNHPGLTATEYSKLAGGNMTSENCAHILHNVVTLEKRLVRRQEHDARTKKILDDPAKVVLYRLTCRKLPNGKAWRYYPCDFKQCDFELPLNEARNQKTAEV